MTDKFSILKKLLKALGLSEERVEELIAWIETWLQDEGEAASGAEEEPIAESYPYRLRDDFLSAAEHRFFQALLLAVTPWAVVCPKVRLADIVYAHTPDQSEWYRARNRIERKHLDFLLCDAQTMQPLLGIELNDRSHQRTDRRKRDRFVVGVFDTVGLPLVGIPVRQHYDAAELGRFLRAKAGISNASPRAVAGSLEPPRKPPICPQCGAPMVQREAKTGPNAGKLFWGCSGFPKCRGILAFAAG